MLGSSLAHFRIAAKLGQGGMGEVWRAEDTKLGREVAIKVLPETFVADPERLARFEREARVLASLNHANIAGIYEVGEAVVEAPEGGGAAGPEQRVHFLVMELAPGETLQQRIARGPIEPAEAVAIARQICAALEAAHERGIVHRDLKPANVSVTPAGAVKVLDFGLAKAFDPVVGAGASPNDLTQSPTLTAQMTGQGVILGTAAYMSPEQAKGMEADKRSDIWAFGVVLCEMLTGRRLFSEPTLSETMAAVLKSEPDLAALPGGVPASLRRLLERCLRKDPRERLHDIADARIVLEEIAEGRDVEPPAVAPADRSRVLFAAATLLVGAILGAAFVGFLSPHEAGEPAARPVLQYVIEHGDHATSRPAISADGHRVAYRRDDAIWVRDLRELEPREVPGTEGGVVPFWSPDGEWLGFSAQERLWKIRLDGTGKTVVTSPAPGATAGGAVWLEDDRILFVTGFSGLYEVPARGGDARVVLEPGEGESDFHDLAALPGGRGFLFHVHEGRHFDNVTVWDGVERREVLAFSGEAVGGVGYSPSGHLLFERIQSGRGLWAAPFSVETLEVTGEPFPIASRTEHASVAAGGTLVYSTSAPVVLSELVVLDRGGGVLRTVGEPRRGLYPSPALSPDGGSVVLPIGTDFGYDLWRYDLDGGEPIRLTLEEREGAKSPVWSPDGREIYFSWQTSTEDGAVRVVRADGTGAMREFAPGRGPVAFSGDVAVWGVPNEAFNFDLFRGPLADPGSAERILDDPGWEQHPAISPDGRLLAYELGPALLIRSLPDLAGPWAVPGGGESPRWDLDGGRLYYLSGSTLMEVGVTAEPSVRLGTPRPLFDIDLAPSAGTPFFDVGPDDTFVVVRSLEPAPGIVVVHNWLQTVR